jgi:hypothetical protein
VEHSVGGSEAPRIPEATLFDVGLDIHSKRIPICVLSEAGQVARRAQVRTLDEMRAIVDARPDRFEVGSQANRREASGTRAVASSACAGPSSARRAADRRFRWSETAGKKPPGGTGGAVPPGPVMA